MKSVEQAIEEAIARGEFKDLPGEGRPIDLSDYFSSPAELRVGYSLLRQAGFKPLVMQLRSDIEDLERLLKAVESDQEKTRLREKLRWKRLAYDIAREESSSR